MPPKHSLHVGVRVPGLDTTNKYLHYEKNCVIFAWFFFSNVSYIIATTISGTPHAVSAESTGKFILIPIDKDSQLSKAFSSPNKTGAVSILQWIEKNDKKLSTKGLEVQPEAKFYI